jgi:eukaryotic-like serine/threonine-protein kinase
VPLVPGSKLGPYEVLSLLGAGGMGEVYRARDPGLKRDVAIKVLRADRMADENRRRRFVQEAQAASALNHPNIVTIHQIDAFDGIDFIVMEYIPGKSLDVLIPRQGMRLGEVLKTAIPIADALTRAHAKGIVHRDLKPANVMVSSEGVVKVLDFGLAKLVSREQASDEEVTKTHDVDHAGPLSRAGAIAGTAGYMSPEQATGATVDSRSDVFAMGAVLYEMVTGRRAFTGRSTQETLTAVVRDQPKAPGQVVSGVPKELDRLIQRCLRKEPERRFQTILDVKLELEQIKEDSESGSATVVAPAPRGRRVWLVAGVAAALVLAVAVWKWVTPKPPLSAPRVVQLTALRGYKKNPTFSPDGEQVAFVWEGEKQDNWDIFVKMVDLPDIRRLTTDKGRHVGPSWSPDGKQIAYLRLDPDYPMDRSNPIAHASIHVVSPLGGSDRKVSDFPAGASQAGALVPAWTPDSRWLAVTRFEPDKPWPLGGIFLVPVQGGELRELTSPKAPGEGHGAPAFSPDGRHLAYVSCVMSPGECQLEVTDLGPDFVLSGSSRRLTKHPVCATARPAWTHDSQSVVYVDCSNGDQPWLRVAIAGDGPPRPIPLVGANELWPNIAASRDRLAFERQQVEVKEIYRFETGRPPEPILASSPVDIMPDLSPDGRRVAFVSSRSGDQGLWVADADFSNASQLTHGVPVNWPRWSPDGKQIAFEDGNKPWHTLTIDADGGSPHRLTQDPGDLGNPSWSRDGRYLYFSRSAAGGTDLWRIPASGGAEERIMHRRGPQEEGVRAFEWVDGKTLFFTAGAALFARPLGGGTERQLVACTTWADVGKGGVYYFGCGEDKAGRPLYVLDPATGQSRLLAKLERATGWFSVSRDGKTILYQVLVSEGSDLMMIDNFR